MRSRYYPRSKNALTLIQSKNRFGYWERIWFHGPGPIPKGWRIVR